MLRETLLKTYRKVEQESEKKTVVDKRILHKTLDGHMTINADVLNVIYNDLNSYENFANLYFAGIAISNKTTAEKNQVSISGLNTFGKGIWLKFEGKQSNKAEYLKNAKNLAALVKDTPWCTSYLASSQLEQGDFFVFVDNEDKPHIAVKMNGNTVDEVRGIKNGNAQELEEEYRDVAIEFLTKNKDVKDGDKWLEKEEWNKRLIMWRNKIEEGLLQEAEVGEMLDDVLNSSCDYKTHGGQKNSNKTALIKSLEKARPQIAKYYGCGQDQICFGDYDKYSSNFNQNVVILGNASFLFSKNFEAKSLTTVGGHVDFRGSENVDASSLTTIGVGVSFYESQNVDVSSLTNIGGNADFSYSDNVDASSLTSIGGYADFSYSDNVDVSSLTSIFEYAEFSNSKNVDASSLTNIGGHANFCLSKSIDVSSLTTIGGDADFYDSENVDVSSLTTIGGYVYYCGSDITDFGKIKFIGGEVYLDEGSVLEAKFKREFRALEEGGYERLPEYLKHDGTGKKKEKDLKE